MATRYTDNQMRTHDVVKTLGGRLSRRRKQRGVWKARWTNVREGKREQGKRRKVTEESIRSTTESVRETPINNDTKFHQRRQNRTEGRGGRDKVERNGWLRCPNQGVTSVQRWRVKPTTTRGEKCLKVFSDHLRRSLAMEIFALSIYFLSQP